MTATGSLSRAQNSMIRRARPGPPQVASTPHEPSTQPRCCEMAKCWSQAGSTAIPFSRARNCTTRRAVAGRPPAASATNAINRRRPCCSTAGSSLQAVLTIPALLQARNSMIFAIRSVLLRKWDPIGVRETAEARDDYDSYSMRLYSFLRQRPEVIC